MTILRNFGQTILFWLHNSRYHSAKQSLYAAILALVMVSGDPEFRLGLGILAALGVVLAHLSANLLDDYFDFKGGAVESRQKMVDGGMRARSKKCSYLLEGKATLGQLFAVGIGVGVVAAAIGAVLFFYRGWPIFYAFLIGALLSYFYSAPPLKLSFHGLGEISVGILFGPVLMFGVAYAACGRFDSGVMLISISVGILVANILYTHSILDLEPDRRAQKRTLAVLLGTPRRAVWGSAFLLAFIYLPIVYGWLRGIFNPIFFLTLLTIPWAVELWRLLRIYAIDPDRPVKRSLWLGPMEYWKVFENLGITWFMIRWFLSRNLLTFFCVLAVISVLCERWFFH